MLNKIWNLFETYGDSIYTEVYSESDGNYINRMINYRDNLYSLTLKGNEKGFKCISISELKER